MTTQADHLVHVPFHALASATGGFAADACIGSGATGEVFKGHLGGQSVAIKLLRLPEIASASANDELLRRFRAELGTLGSLRHPHLVHLFGYSVDPAPTSSHPFALVFELLQDGSLADWLRGPAGQPPRKGAGSGVSSLSAEARIDIALGAALGLAFLHAGGSESGAPVGGSIAGASAQPPPPILHRDVKAANIGLDGLTALLTAVGSQDAPSAAQTAAIAPVAAVSAPAPRVTAKLLDCGLAKAVRGGAVQAAAAAGVSFTGGLVAGTPGYMAPECANATYTVRSEVFSFGVVLLELLSGARVGFSTAREVIKAARRDGVAPVAARADSVWASAPVAAHALAALVAECTRDDEEDRPGSMDHVISRVEEIRALLVPQPAAHASSGAAPGSQPAGTLTGSRRVVITRSHGTHAVTHAAGGAPRAPVSPEQAHAELFSDVLLFASQAGFALDLAPAAAACKATWWDQRLWEILVHEQPWPVDVVYSPSHTPDEAQNDYLRDDYEWKRRRDAEGYWQLGPQEGWLPALARARPVGTTALLAAASCGDASRVAWLLQCGADVDATVPAYHHMFGDSDAQFGASGTALAVACAGGHTGAVLALLKGGASINSVDFLSTTPLHLACVAGHQDLALALLERGADVSTGNTFGVSPIDVACERGLVRVVPRMLECNGVRPFLESVTGAGSGEYGRDPNRTRTPLSRACLSGDGAATLVSALLQSGARTNAADFDRATPLMHACASGDAALASVLLDAGAEVNAHTPDGATPLFVACLFHHEPVALLLLARGALVVEPEYCSLPLLHRACKAGMLGLTRALLEQGGWDVNQQCNECGEWSLFTPLHYACAGGHTEISRELLHRGADLNLLAGFGYSALALAVKGGFEALVRLLLEAGADLRGKLGSSDYGHAGRLVGCSPFELACYTGATSIAVMLAERGALRDQQCADRALQYAVEGRHMDIAQSLIMRGASLLATDLPLGGTMLHGAVRDGGLAFVQLVLQHGADVNARNEEKDTPLLVACKQMRDSGRQGHHIMFSGLLYRERKEDADACVERAFALAQLLIARGADVAARNMYGLSPLELAFEAGHEPLIRLLIQHGATIEGPMLYAGVGSDRVEIVRGLLDGGLGADSCNRSGQSPLDLACRSGNEAIALLLIERGALVGDRSAGLLFSDAFSCAVRGGLVTVVRTMLGWEAAYSKRYTHASPPGLPVCTVEKAGNEDVAMLVLQRVWLSEHTLPVSPAVLLDLAGALYAMAGEGFAAAVQVLLQRGADPSQAGRFCGHPLVEACKMGHEGVVRLLLQHGARVDAFDREKLSPLHHACHGGHEAIALLLLEHGADISAKCEGNITPFQLVHYERRWMVPRLTRASARAAAVRAGGGSAALAAPPDPMDQA